MEDRVISQQRTLHQESLVDVDARTPADHPAGPHTFQQLLLKLREERGLSKAELAKRAGLDPSSITRFEQGTRAPERPSIIQIADAMVLPTADRDRLLASAGFRSELWDDPSLVDLVVLLNDESISETAKSEVRSVLRMVTAFLRMQRLRGA